MHSFNQVKCGTYTRLPKTLLFKCFEGSNVEDKQKKEL